MADQYDEAKAAAKRFKDIFGDNFALELQAHNLQIRQCAWSGPVNQQKINLALKKIANELDIRCIVTTDAHYVKQEHARAHDVYLCNSSGQPITSGNRLKYDKHEFYMRSVDSLYAHFERHIKMWGEDFVRSLFENTEYYSEQCEKPDFIDPAVVTGDKNQLPEFPVKDEPDYQEFLEWQKTSNLYSDKLKDDSNFYRYRSELGLEKKIKDGKIKEEDRQTCIDQMMEEFDVLEFRNFSSYMLIVSDFLNWCRNNDIPISPGRGSVGGCLTAYLNGIHQANPFKYGLIFARFLNKFKADFPDIDSDCSPNGRPYVHEYLRKKYGSNCVAAVSNFNTITPKVYARDLARIFDFGGEGRTKAAEIGEAIADSIPAEIGSVKSALKDAPLFAEYAKQYPELQEFSEIINGLPRSLGTHAGGLVISKSSLEGITTVRRETEGNLILEAEKETTHDLGYVKIDILVVKTLDIIKDTYDLINANGKVLSMSSFDYEIEDEKTYNLIGSGDTFGVFQLGGTAVHVCKKIQPKNIDDIALISALVRPAAKDIIPNLMKVRNGEVEMELVHPKLTRAFSKTYGFGLYEESLMYLALDIAGWDLHDADKLRKLTKEKGKNPEKVKQWRDEFIRDAIKNGIDEEIAIKIWDETISGFQGYGFNQSHATLYSMISFQTAWLKAHYPVHFLLANLKSQVNSNAKVAKDNINKIKGELRAMGVKLVPPDVNTSNLSWQIVNDQTLMAGLDSLKFMGSDAIPELIAKRPFTSFQDLIHRTDASKVRANSIQAMAASGSLDCFGMDRKQMFTYASDYRAKLKAHMAKLDKTWAKEYGKENNLTLKKGELDWRNVDGNVVVIPTPPETRVKTHLDLFKYPFPEDKPWTLLEMFAFEEYYMGEGISGDKFDHYPKFFDRNKSVPFDAITKMFPYEEKFEDERNNRKANTYYLGNYQIRPLEVVITSVFSFIVKKEDSKIFGQEMARLTVQDPWGTESTLLCFPEAWGSFKERVKMLGKGLEIEAGLAIRFLGNFQWENDHMTSFVLTDVLDVKGPPKLPEDKKAKKVKMPRGKRVVAEEVAELSKEELMDKLEEEVVDDGLVGVDDEDE